MTAGFEPHVENPRGRFYVWWHSGPFLTPGAAVTLIVVVLGFGWGIHLNQQSIDQVKANRESASATNCATQRTERAALRDVVTAAFPATPRPPVVIPPTPGVSPETIALLNQLINGTGSSTATAALRDLLLSKAPPIRCVFDRSTGLTMAVSTKG